MLIRWVLAASAFCLVGCNMKLPLEATEKGAKPGTSVVTVHVKSTKSARVECMPGGLKCKAIDIGASDEGDLDVDLADSFSDTPKKVVLRAKVGPREATIELPIKATSLVPASVAVDEKGAVSCVTKTCSGTLTVTPAGHVTITTAPGTIVEVGSSKVTANAQGIADGAVDIAMAPPFKDMPLKTVCGAVKPVGSTTLGMTFADGAKVSTSVPLTPKLLAAGFATSLQNATKGAVLFPWEKGAAVRGPKRGVAYLIGNACFTDDRSDAKVSDTAVVVTTTDVVRNDTCVYNLSGEKSLKSKGSATGKIRLHDETATGYDRATGKAIGSKMFKAEKKCDDSFSLKAAEGIPDQDAYPGSVEIVQWAATLR